jgi:hypothetical protein
MIKTRIFPEHNYKGIHINGKTIRIALDPKKPIDELRYPEFYDVKVTSFCKGNCPYCFVEGSEIKTLDGVKNIEEISINDSIINFDEKTSNITSGKVEQLHKRQYEGELIAIELENGEIIKCTPNHKFYVNGLWVEAKDLTEKDILKGII